VKLSSEPLTELEGALMVEIHHRGMTTAFKVRRAFQLSMSSEWSGSAGAVSPAIRRLEAAGLLKMGEPEGARRARQLSLTPLGEAKLKAWSLDAEKASNIGLDPFRIRAGLWAMLPEVERSALFEALRRTTEAQLASLPAYGRDRDETERVAIGIVHETLKVRLAWLDGFESDRKA